MSSDVIEPTENTIHFGVCPECEAIGQIFRTGKCAHCYIAELEGIIEQSVAHLGSERRCDYPEHSVLAEAVDHLRNTELPLLKAQVRQLKAGNCTKCGMGPMRNSCAYPEACEHPARELSAAYNRLLLR